MMSLRSKKNKKKKGIEEELAYKDKESFFEK